MCTLQRFANGSRRATAAWGRWPASVGGLSPPCDAWSGDRVIVSAHDAGDDCIAAVAVVMNAT
jgi:hypothetical protein